MPLFYALTASGLNAVALALLVGILVGVIGHITRSRTLIIAGILIVGALSVYFGFVVAKVR